MRITLIGGAGAVGQSLIPYMSENHRIRVLDIHPLTPTPGVESLQGDALDPEALKRAFQGADGVVHLAALVPRGVSPDSKLARKAFELNVYGVFSALHLAAQSGVSRFIHISSLSVFRDYGQIPVDPTLPPDATNPYGMSKLLAEQICSVAAQENPTMTVTSLRLAVPTTQELWPLWRSPSAPQSEPIQLQFGDHVVDALHPSDLASAMEWALGRDGAYLALPVAGDRDGVTFRGSRGWVPRFGTGQTEGGHSKKST